MSVPSTEREGRYPTCWPAYFFPFFLQHPISLVFLICFRQRIYFGTLYRMARSGDIISNGPFFVPTIAVGKVELGIFAVNFIAN
jgi:hypothetical protein